MHTSALENTEPYLVIEVEEQIQIKFWHVDLKDLYMMSGTNSLIEEVALQPAKVKGKLLGFQDQNFTDKVQWGIRSLTESNSLGLKLLQEFRFSSRMVAGGSLFNAWPVKSPHWAKLKLSSSGSILKRFSRKRSSTPEQSANISKINQLTKNQLLKKKLTLLHKNCFLTYNLQLRFNFLNLVQPLPNLCSPNLLSLTPVASSSCKFGQRDPTNQTNEWHEQMIPMLHRLDN